MIKAKKLSRKYQQKDYRETTNNYNQYLKTSFSVCQYREKELFP